MRSVPGSDQDPASGLTVTAASGVASRPRDEHPVAASTSATPRGARRHMPGPVVSLSAWAPPRWPLLVWSGAGAPGAVRTTGEPDEPAAIAAGSAGMAVRAEIAPPGRRSGHRGGSNMAEQQAVPENVTPEQFFEQLLPAGYAAQKAEGAAVPQDFSMQYHVTGDGGGDWHVEIKDGV